MNIFKKAFTLIELLIVIAIIGILAALIMTNLQGARERARDARRKSDLHAVAQALRMYYNDNQKFPANDGDAITGAAWGSTFQSAGGTIYMKSLPHDPASTTTDEKNYVYSSSDGDSYTLTATLENKSDPDAVDSQTRCGAGTGTDYVVCE